MTRIVLAVAALVVLALPAATTASTTRSEARPTIAGLATQTKQLSTLLSLVKKAGLADELAASNARLTVFAPTNAAFAKLPKATLTAVGKDPALLKRVLLYHVVQGKVTAAQVLKLRSAKTLAGPSVRIRTSGSTVKVNTATVVQADVLARNGVVHVVDRVLIPPS
jgi:uncharacterized surface protein with fasciclin (FAS1) repeats